MTIELTEDEWTEVMNALETFRLVYPKANSLGMTFDRDVDTTALDIGIEKLGLLCAYRLNGEIHLSGQTTHVMMDIGDYQHWHISTARLEKSRRLQEQMENEK